MVWSPERKHMLLSDAKSSDQSGVQAHTTKLNPSEVHTISAFFYFIRLADVHGDYVTQLTPLREEFEQAAEQFDIRGLLILGPDGINTTCSASNQENMQAFKSWVIQRLGCNDIAFKDSTSDRAPFRRYRVKIRDEIVTAGVPDLMPPKGKNYHLSPDEWNKVMKEEDVVVIDTRNWYEYDIGTFKGALNPDIEKFTEFPKYIEDQGISKDKKMLIFCTGGIRCEKGILELQKQGYSQVYQLEGGILNYLDQHPDDQFEGECFVFDHRVAVDQNLKPSKIYDLCPHCGQPASTDVTCKRCDTVEKVCNHCLELEFKKDTCSKNCAHQWQLNPGRKGKPQVLEFDIAHKSRKSVKKAAVHL